MKADILVPEEIRRLCGVLREGGYRACPVGGCIRDSLLGRVPEDWDVATSAPPGEILRRFPGSVPTGGVHGTVTVRAGKRTVEVTPFRGEGGYSDGRHPDHVTFGVPLEEDLGRRDFTMNAMALDEGGVLIDPYGGWDDLKAGLIRCVGRPERRFEEDGLRILRALRFASGLGMKLEEKTAEGLRQKRGRLKDLPAERVTGEFTRLLEGKYVERVLLDYPDVLAVPLPEIVPAVGFDHCNPRHDRDVWEHTAAVVSAVPPERGLRWAALLHDLGKPAVFRLDEKGIGRFRGHGEKSRELAENIAERLRFDGELRREVRFLVEHHDDRMPPEEKAVKEAIQQFGAENVRKLLALFRADAQGHSGDTAAKRLAQCDGIEAQLRALAWMGERFTVRDLALSGGELAKLGLSGADIGRAQRMLLEYVLERPEDNTPMRLRQILAEWRHKEGKHGAH